SNFLLLDEPTNHLDLRAKDVLLEALQEFSGTLVFVSHDRYFIDRLATSIFEIGEGQVCIYPGNYEDYLWRKQRGETTVETVSVSAAGPPAADPEDAKPKRLNPIKLRQLQERCQAIEEEIARAEAEIAGYEAELADFKSAEETMRLSGLLDQRLAGLGRLMAEWEEASALLS
ncbi:MAG: ABC transporter ATP-binding protein, partial [Acidobacteria bacterium]|nr:ABC transporter ATP-binding protein [Acidobacteriota bacterium]